jgi:hypothetical protein
MKLIAIAALLFVIVASVVFWSYRKSAETHNDTALLSSDDDPGEFVSTIVIKLKATQEQLEDFPNGVLPWINIEKTESAIQQLIDPEEIVIAESEAILIIDYPLSKEKKFVLKSTSNGFTRKQLLQEISRKYHEIYEIEESTATVKTVPREKRVGLSNRNQTDGEFGIWGHDLGDLDLSEIDVYKDKDGKIHITLDVQS